MLGAAAAPSEDAFGRFLAVVMEQRDELLDIFHQLVEAVSARLPRLGEKLAVDSKAISSFGRPVKDEEKKQAVDRRRDVDADWGAKTYKGARADGSKWEKTSYWFGYKLHLLVDAVYELPLAFDMATASSSDMLNLMPLLEALFLGPLTAPVRRAA